MTQIHRRSVMAGASAATAGLATRSACAPPARTQPAPIRVGVLTDLSTADADTSGPGSVVATHMAVADVLATKPGFAVEVVVADVQNMAAGSQRDFEAAFAGGHHLRRFPATCRHDRRHLFLVGQN